MVKLPNIYKSKHYILPPTKKINKIKVCICHYFPEAIHTIIIFKTVSESEVPPIDTYIIYFLLYF